MAVWISNSFSTLTDLYELMDVDDNTITDIDNNTIFFIWESQVYLTTRS